MGRDGNPKVSVEELEVGIEEFQENCVDRKRPFTMAGLAKYLKIHEETLINYAKDRPEFSSLLKEAKQIAKVWMMEGALVGEYNPTMAIFLLKVNHGMQDKVVTENKNEDTVTNIIIQEDTKQSE